MVEEVKENKLLYVTFLSLHEFSSKVEEGKRSYYIISIVRILLELS